PRASMRHAPQFSNAHISFPSSLMSTCTSYVLLIRSIKVSKELLHASYCDVNGFSCPPRQKGTHMNKRATSRDVASLAGVSQSTVSFVFNGRGGISEPTKKRVLEAAAQLNYRPNLAARSMRTGRTKHLAVALTVAALNPLELLHGATKAAEEAGYALDVVYVAGAVAAR